MNLNTIALVSGVLAFIVAYLATPFVIKFAKRIGIIDDPKDSDHPKVIHKYPVPRGGGLAIYIGVLIAALIFLPIDKYLLSILLGAGVMVGVGLLDDKHNLNPYARLGAGMLAASIPIIAGIGIAYTNIPFNGILDLSHPQLSFQLLGETRSIWILSDIFALLWIVFMMNMLNMGAKGVDGQLPGVVVIAALTIAAMSFRYSADITQWPVIILAMITAGAYLGFLPWNFYPQRIMPSYGGAALAGFLLAILSILSTAKVGTLAIVLAVPLIDTGYTMVRRVATGKSPVWGDTGHLHHRLLKLGWSKKKVAVFYWAVSASLGALALNLNSVNKFYTIVGVALVVGGLILWLAYKPDAKNTKA